MKAKIILSLINLFFIAFFELLLVDYWGKEPHAVTVFRMILTFLVFSAYGFVPIWKVASLGYLVEKELSRCPLS